MAVNPGLEQFVRTAFEARATDLESFLTPVLVLAAWTCVMWVWLYVTRIPAMQKAKVNPQSARHPGGEWNDKLPASVRAAADNYNHLHEQPTIFYAIMGFAALTGGADSIALYLAWAYVGLRIVHSLVQVVIGNVTMRFAVFSLASFALIALVVKEVLRVFL
ncbi:MAG: MAPEG family protein [Pseudomonadota bacterium]